MTKLCPLLFPVFLELVAITLFAQVCSGQSSDQDRLQGTWRSFEVQQGKKKSSGDSKGATGMTVTFGGDQISHQEHEHSIFSGTFTINPQTNPKQIDVTVGKGGEFKAGVKLLGIFKFDGDNLIL